MVNNTGIRSLISAYDALGLPERKSISEIPPDISIESILQKITNPGIAARLGASERTIEAIHHLELTANLLDAYSETGDRRFLMAADREYAHVLNILPDPVRLTVQLRSAAALSYFHYERDVINRIKKGEFFLIEETIEYLFRRGSDAPIYAAVLSADGIFDRTLTAGFRLRQALWDLEDDTRDLQQDMLTIGANVLLMSTMNGNKSLGTIADSLYAQAHILSLPEPMITAIDMQYQKTAAALENL